MSGLLEGDVAIVTGAARGIGAATVRQLAEAGATVIAVDVDDAVLKASVAGLDTVRLMVLDLLDADAPRQLVEHGLATAGRIDIIVNCAGFTWDAPVGVLSDDQWESMLTLLVTVPFRIARAVAPHFKARADAEAAEGLEGPMRKFISVAALEGVAPRPGAANYCAANSALIGFTSSVAKEWARLRVCANSVAFGPVQTRQLLPSGAVNRFSIGGYDVRSGIPAATASMMGLKTEAKETYAEAEIYGVGEKIASVRPITVSEAAELIFYLCSTASDAVSGVMLAVGAPRRL